MTRARTARTTVIAPPTMGLNTKDPIAAMDPSYCVSCRNFFSDGTSVDLRNGYSFYSSGIGGDYVNNVTEYATQKNGVKLMAWGDDRRPYDCTGGGAATDLSNAGTFVMSIGGAPYGSVVFRNLIFWKAYEATHDVYYWDGVAASLALAAFTGPSGDDKALFGPAVYKSRIYFIEFEASAIWYGGVDAITGALTQFNVQSILTLGGKLMFIGNVTRTGNLDSSYFVMITDQGEVLVYEGDNPSSATWGLVGHFYMPAPLGRSSFCYMGPNLIILTNQGVLALSEVLSGNANLTYLSDKIAPTWKAAVVADVGSAYWSVVYYPKGQMLVVHTGYDLFQTSPLQFVMSIVTGGWWLWDIPAQGFGIHSGNLYFGSNGDGAANGAIYRADNGYFDELNTSGGVRTRTIELRPSYNYMGSPTKMKQFLLAKPHIYQSEGLALTVDADVDFGNVTATQSIATDTTDTSYKLYNPTIALHGIGKCMSLRIDGTVTTKRISLQSTEILWNDGGVIF